MAWASRNAMRVEGRKQCIAQKKIYRTGRPLIERHSKPKSEKCVYKRQLQNTSLALGTRTLSATRFLRIAESVVAAWEKSGHERSRPGRREEAPQYGNCFVRLVARCGPCNRLCEEANSRAPAGLLHGALEDPTGSRIDD